MTIIAIFSSYKTFCHTCTQFFLTITELNIIDVCPERGRRKEELFCDYFSA